MKKVLMCSPAWSSCLAKDRFSGDESKDTSDPYSLLLFGPASRLPQALPGLHWPQQREVGIWRDQFPWLACWDSLRGVPPNVSKAESASDTVSDLSSRNAHRKDVNGHRQPVVILCDLRGMTQLRLYKSLGSGLSNWLQKVSFPTMRQDR